MRNFSLRQQLVLPFTMLVIFVASSIGWVSYRAGEQAVEILARRVLADMVDRIGNATERHLSGALTALQSISPDPATVPKVQPFSDDLSFLEERFWAASGLFMEVNNYVYFAGTDGRFIGVNRVKRNFVELYVREPGAQKRSVYAVLAPGDRGRLIRTDNYDGRLRPWYGAAAHKIGPVWSEVYSDFSSKEPTITLAKSVYRRDLALAGVLATDVTLKTLTDFLRALTVSQHGVAFVIDSAGLMVATSGDEVPVRIENGVPARQPATEMHTALIRESAMRISRWRNAGAASASMSATFSSEVGTVELAAAHLGQKYGVDWISVVAVPRADFMGGVTRGVFQSVAIALACVAVTLILGLTVLNRLLQDLQKLSNAARKIGNGEILPRLNITRTDEIGVLASTFAEMEHNLRTDRLTQVSNRESFQAQIGLLEKRAAALPGAGMVFGVMFVDLDHFKAINDRYGHAAGDHVLIEIAARLRRAVDPADAVARYGGDEFVLLLKSMETPRDMIDAELRVRAVAEQPITLPEGTVSVGLSIGWALFPRDGSDAHALLQVADARMFRVKNDRRALSR